MFIYDELIESINLINNKYQSKSLKVDLNQKFSENTNQLIFKDKKAFELGGNTFKGIDIDLVTDQEFADEIILFGDDLNSIKEDQNYARITLGSIDNDLIGKGNTLYNNVRRFDYIKYKFAFDGIMVRESAFNKKESLLVSKEALKNKVDFSILGSYFISKYKTLPFVKNVKVIFISLKDYDYKSLENILEKSEDITKALDHLMNKVNMDCHSCSLQVICNEVEKKVKEDFK